MAASCCSLTVAQIDSMLSQESPALGIVVGAIVRKLKVCRQTKITQFEMAVAVEQKVVGLDVSVDKAEIVCRASH